MPTAPIVECVPNVSEGRDPGRLRRLRAVVAAVPGVTLANVHADPDHHRSVFTFLGRPDAVAAGALALADAVLAEIDMRAHRGIHPRLGALDVVPFVPLAGVTMAEAVTLARQVGHELAKRHALPVYYYGQAARGPGRRTLRELRHGEYEGLAERLATPDGAPDDGPARGVRRPRAGRRRPRSLPPRPLPRRLGVGRTACRGTEEHPGFAGARRSEGYRGPGSRPPI